MTIRIVLDGDEPEELKPLLPRRELHRPARTSDPVASHLAAALNKEQRLAVANAGLIARYHYREYALNDYEAAVLAGVDHVECFWHRVGSDLRTWGYIEFDGRRTKGKYNATREVSYINEAGIAEAERLIGLR